MFKLQNVQYLLLIISALCLGDTQMNYHRIIMRISVIIVSLKHTERINILSEPSKLTFKTSCLPCCFLSWKLCVWIISYFYQYFPFIQEDKIESDHVGPQVQTSTHQKVWTVQYKHLQTFCMVPIYMDCNSLKHCNRRQKICSLLQTGALLACCSLKNKQQNRLIVIFNFSAGFFITLRRAGKFSNSYL